MALVITAAGLDAIGVTPEDEQQATEPPTPRPGSENAAPSEHCQAAVGEGAGPATTPRVGTKLTAVVQLLQREGGATIDEIVAATGWLAHTARAALTGLRKRDATSPASFERLLEGERAQMVFTDPPYNVPIRGHVSGLGKVQHRDFAMASGDMSAGEFVAFLTDVFRNQRDHSADGSIHFICMDWRHMGEMLEAGRAVYTELKNLIVWAKDNGGMGTFRSRHELVFAFKCGTAAHINTFELGQHGCYRTNGWQYKGVNTLKAGRMEELELHPTVKPVAMIADAIKDVSERGGIVLDCFGGSGSTLIAAHKTARRAMLMELDPVYVDRTIRRWQAYAKDDAVHAESGETFDALLAREGRIRGQRHDAEKAQPSTRARL